MIRDESQLNICFDCELVLCDKCYKQDRKSDHDDRHNVSSDSMRVAQKFKFEADENGYDLYFTWFNVSAIEEVFEILKIDLKSIDYNDCDDEYVYQIHGTLDEISVTSKEKELRNIFLKYGFYED
jgi:transcription initiation factor TFIIIB Brf1 subunit/transcription initiation factor TFIIB